MDETEPTLVKTAQQGDLDSFGTLCQRYESALAAIAYATLGDHHLAEDAAQESFAKALSRFRAEASFQVPCVHLYRAWTDSGLGARNRAASVSTQGERLPRIRKNRKRPFSQRLA